MNQDNIKEKAELRKRILILRRDLDDNLRLEFSEDIIRRALDLKEVSDAKTIHIFVGSLPGEVETMELINAFLALEKNVIVPVISKMNEPLTHSRLLSTEHLERNKYGLQQPRAEHIIDADPKNANLIIVPGVAFDHNGGRLGMGGGYYDKLLDETDVPILALAFSFQIVNAVPREKHDMKVDIIVTEKEVVRRGG